MFLSVFSGKSCRALPGQQYICIILTVQLVQQEGQVLAVVTINQRKKHFNGLKSVGETHPDESRKDTYEELIRNGKILLCLFDFCYSQAHCRKLT